MYIMIVFDKTAAPGSPSPRYARTAVMTGGPLEVDGVRYNSMESKDDPQGVQTAIVEDFSYWVKDLIEDEWDVDKTNNGLGVDKFILLTFLEDLLFTLLVDALRAVFAMVFVWIVITIHLRSACLSCLGIGLIAFSFPISIFLCSAIF